MSKWFIVFIMSFNFGAAFARTSDQKNVHVYQPQALAIAEYMTNFKTVGDCLNSLTETGLISQNDQSLIKQILKDKNISLNDELTGPEIKGNKYSWGPSTLLMNADGTIQTGAGKFLRFKKEDSLDQVFLKTLEAFQTQKTTMIHSLWINQAYAEAKKQPWYAAAFYYLIHKGIQTAATTFNLAVTASGLQARLLESAVVTVGDWVNKGKLECRGADYVYNAGYKYTNWLQEFKQNQLAAERSAGEDNIGFSTTLYGTAGTAFETWLNIFSPDKEYGMSVSGDVLKSVFPPHEEYYGGGKSLSKTPACNSENLKLVKAFINKKADKVTQTLKQALVSQIKKSEIQKKSLGSSQN